MVGVIDKADVTWNIFYLDNHDSGSVIKLAVVGENSFNKCPTS